MSELCGLRWQDAIASRGGDRQINVSGKGRRTHGLDCHTYEAVKNPSSKQA
ncbi:hypothetical protein JYQ62_30180 [Nostoc sp. UHCC 0702]|nr:hypothetical protein JYQ62_30180 [Nostoc sp. UHCC 0702]